MICQYALACIRAATHILVMPWGDIAVCTECKEFYERQNRKPV